MKRALLIILLVITTLMTNSLMAQSIDGHETFIGYGTFGGKKVQLVHDSSDNTICFRTEIDFIASIGNEELAFMRHEVETLYASGDTIPIGFYTIRFHDGYPVWAPYTSMGPSDDYSCLLFSRKAYMNGNHIDIYGEPKKGAYYPYRLISKMTKVEE